MPPTQSEIQSLLKLLCDDNRFVSEAAAQRLYEVIDNHETYTQLLQATNGDDLILQLRVRHILDRHRLENYQQTFKAFAKEQNLDLETGCKLVASEDYHQEEVDKISSCLDELAEELKPTFLQKETEDDKANCLVKFLFEKKNFHGNRENYFALDNSFLNRVLETKQGIPLTLGLITILLGKRLHFNFQPISVPTHFLVHYGDQFDINYLDPFNGGRKLTRQECFDFLKRVGVVPHPTHLEPATTRHVLARLLRNLAAIYHQSKAHAHATVIEKRIQWLSET